MDENQMHSDELMDNLSLYSLSFLSPTPDSLNTINSNVEQQHSVPPFNLALFKQMMKMVIEQQDAEILGAMVEDAELVATAASFMDKIAHVVEFCKPDSQSLDADVFSRASTPALDAVSNSDTATKYSYKPSAATMPPEIKPKVNGLKMS